MHVRRGEGTRLENPWAAWPVPAMRAAEQTSRRSVAHAVSGFDIFGKRRWAIAEGYIPGRSVDPDNPALESHEAACLLNATDRDAAIAITVYFENREPAGPYHVTVPARRTKHLRFNDLSDPEPIPRNTSYSSVIESSVPIVVQHSRLDSRNTHVALLTTMAFALE